MNNVRNFNIEGTALSWGDELANEYFIMLWSHINWVPYLKLGRNVNIYIYIYINSMMVDKSF